MTALYWLALDGVGHPADAPPFSPWDMDLPTLRPVIEAGRALDATLGVEGLPQSATGQSCWLTGQDAVARMGGHYGPHPGPTLKRLLDEAGLPGRVRAAGGQAALLNYYPPGYFAQPRLRAGCFPYSFTTAGLPQNPPGLPHLPPTLGLQYTAPWTAVDPPDHWRRQGERLAALPGQDLLVLDLWFSDLLGHQGRAPTPPDLLWAGQAYLARLDALLEGLLHAGARVVLSSDHGNFEDLGVKSHTRARVPFAGVGVELGLPDDVVQGGQVMARLLGL
ncbi:metalloenzyme domain protein [Deinococcus sonorensis]|uniref:Metalloenzyme domain protein n=2 Tax=Deinococcus sonorensis TaxID=309891 RepID=A0AAU7UFS3_9DEIO